MIRGMQRVRISTTVDGGLLRRARHLAGMRDSDLFDKALESVVRELNIERERAALERFPYTADAELLMPEPPGDSQNELAYDGKVPKRVRQLAEKRRAQHDDS